MKTALRLAILVATLLLVTNVAFAADPCDEQVCYDVLYTYEDGTSDHQGWFVCLNDNATGTINGGVSLALFGGGPLWGDFDNHFKWTKWIIYSTSFSGDIWTDMFGVYLNGEGYNSVEGGRWIAKGRKVPCPF